LAGSRSATLPLASDLSRIDRHDRKRHCGDWRLLTSTLLSLLVVPVIFELMDGLEQRSRGLFGRLARG